VSDQQRKDNAAIVDTLYNQALTIANTQFNGTYIFGGDKSTSAPFVSTPGGVQFVGSTNVLQNTYAPSTNLAFMVNGANVFGALSSQVQGNVDLTPDLTAQTRIADLRGTNGSGVQLGSILLSNGTVTKSVDLSKADTVNDVVNAINAAGVGGITASLSGQGFSLTGGASDDISVQDVGGGATAADLGILQATPAGAGNPVAGASVQPNVTLLTPLSALRGGQGIDTADGLKITNGSQSANVSFSGASNVQDLLNAINGSGTYVQAQINASGTGIDILNSTQGSQMTISENGGTTAADLGVRSFSPSTPLSDLNDGKGIQLAASGADFQVTRSDGTNFSVSLAGAQTVQDVIDDINAASGGVGLTASFSTSGNGIVLNDTAGGTGTPSVTAQNFSTAAADLGLTTAASGNVIAGSDVNPVTADGIFAHLASLRDALNSSDTAQITQAAQDLTNDQNNVVTVRGQVGANEQDMEARQTQIQDENVATQSLLSNLTDTDYASAITRFQSLQQSLQATLQVTATMSQQSLLDFLS
jgi:flagellin-like hook-associated protein FlgL